MITEYKVLDSNGRYSLLEVHLITGRTHQIRATMAEIATRWWAKANTPP